MADLSINNDGFGLSEGEQVMGTWAGGHFTVIKHEVIYIRAIPNSGYDFVNWTTTLGTPTIHDVNSDGVTVPNYVSLDYDPPSDDGNIQANFISVPFILTDTNDGHGTTVRDIYNPLRGVPYSIEAVPSTGYRFVNWTVVSGPATFGNANDALTTVIITGNATILANFAIMTDYTLPDVVIKGETYSIKFIGCLAGYSAPTQNLLISMGNRNEKLEGDPPDNPTKQTIQNMDFEFIDKDNFFYDLLTNSCNIQVWRNTTILEFDGIVDLDSKDFPETFVSSIKARRHAKFTAISSLNKLDDIDIDTMVAAIKASQHLAGQPPDHHYLCVERMFSEFMYQLGTVNTSYAKPIIDNHDFKYYRTLTQEEAPWIDGLYVDTNDTCFDDFPNDPYNYKTAKDLLIALARNFGFAPIVYYDSVNSCYRLRLVTQRSRSTTYGTFLPLKDGGSTKIFVKKPKAVVFEHNDERSGVYIGQGKQSQFYHGDTTEPDPTPSYDRETILHFGVSPASTGLICWYNNAWTKVEAMTYYDYNTKTWSARETYCTDAFLKYFLSIWYLLQSGYNRTVKGFSSNQLGTMIQMNDGTETKDYMITSFERDYMNKEEIYSLVEVA